MIKTNDSTKIDNEKPKDLNIYQFPFAVNPNPSEVINIMPLLRKHKDNVEEMIRKLGDDVKVAYDADERSRKGWLAGVARSIKLFSNFVDHRLDATHYSNSNLPMLAIACLQFHARAFDALIPPKEIVNIIAFGDEDIPKAERVKRWMNYELIHKMEEFEEGMDNSLLQLPIEGSVFRKTGYDPVKKRNISEYISAQNLVVPYTTKVTIEDAPRKTHVIYLSEYEMSFRAVHGIFDKENTALAIKGTVRSTPGIVDKVSQDVQGVQQSNVVTNDDKEIGTIKILEQHCWKDFDGDNIAEPYVITVDYTTGLVLRITDRRYYDTAGKMQVIEYFTHYKLIPNPEGFYGLGFGILLTGLNEAANDIVNEVIEAGYLANTQGGFVSKRSGIKRGTLTFKRGEYKEVDTYIDDIAKAIMHLEFKGPNQTLYAVLGLLYEYSKLVSSISETMTGQLPASDTPATTVMALIEEGRKVFSSIHKRIHRAFKKELKKLFRLNSIFLDEAEYKRVLGDKFVEQVAAAGIVISRADFADTLDVLPVSDPNIISRAEKVLKAQQAYQTIISSPVTAGNQKAAFISLKRYFEALEIPNIDELMQSLPEPPDLPPEEENGEFLKNKTSKVYPQQNHSEHLVVHDSLINGAYGGQLTPDSLKMVDAHKREHISFMYMADTTSNRAHVNAQALAVAAQAGRL